MSAENDFTNSAQAAVAAVTTSIWRARFVFLIIKPIQYALTMAYFAACLYAGTWIVVLALRHASVL